MTEKKLLKNSFFYARNLKKVKSLVLIKILITKYHETEVTLFLHLIIKLGLSVLIHNEKRF